MQPHKRSKDPLLIFTRNPDAVVLDLYPTKVLANRRRHDNIRLNTLRHKLDRVGNEIEHDLIDAVREAGDFRQGAKMHRNLDPAILRPMTNHVHGRFDAGVEVESLQELHPESADWSAELAQFIESSTDQKAAP